MIQTTAHDAITAASMAEFEADFVRSLTTYARRRRRDSALYGDAPPGVDVALWRAYGPHYPGGPKRAAEALAAAQHLRERVAPSDPPAKGMDLRIYGGRICERCGSVYDGRGKRFCSRACSIFRSPRPSPEPAEVVAEMTRALASARRGQAARDLWARAHRQPVPAW